MYDRPLYWEQGTFLQPQHLQLLHWQATAGASSLRGMLVPHLWGVYRLTVREDALATGFFEVIELDMVLPDGAHLVTPGNTVPLNQSFTKAWVNADQPLLVWLAVAPESAMGQNVAETDEVAEAPESARFMAPLTPETLPDLQGSGPGAPVRTLLYNVRLGFGHSLPESSDRVCVPLAQLEKEGERVVQSRSFSPPCLDVHAVPVLRELFRDVRDTVISRARQLEEYKIVAGEGAAVMATSAQSLALFTILGVLARSAPELEHFYECPVLHPWQAYGALRRLVGELSVFSAELSPLGETSQGRRVLPPYDHEAPAACFEAAKIIITRLVDSLVVGPAYTLRLEPEGDLFTTIIPSGAIGGEFRYWLLLRSAQTSQIMGGAVRHYLKCGAMSDIRSLVSNALPGLRLTHTDNPPAGLPRRGDTSYYAVDHDDPLWREVLNQGKLALFFPGAPEDLHAYLAVIQR